MSGLLIRALLCAGAVFWLTGCATAMHGTTEAIHIDSDPPGAAVKIDGMINATTPATVELSRNQDHLLKFEKPGYEPTAATVSRSSNKVASFAGGGLVGLAVDSSNGASNELVPSSVYVTLHPIPQAITAAPPPASADDTEAQLRHIQKLHDDKLISDDEYRAMREKVLSRTLK